MTKTSTVRYLNSDLFLPAYLAWGYVNAFLDGVFLRLPPFLYAPTLRKSVSIKSYLKSRLERMTRFGSRW